ncbi:MarR family transcriptional regulator [Streptomyces sp. NPDC052114]|uniref:MarR family transcriptional regulator n=1 Tax=unclassified Streptomyces TaxID=2593676 RepID=UPI003418597B
MPDPPRGLPDPAGHGLLSRALDGCAADAVTGGLRVVGRPGGLFRLRQGRVVEAESPGAPGPEVLLLRSGRLSERDWSEALAASGDATRLPAAELVARGLVDAAELRVLRAMTTRDAVFALLAGDVRACVPEAGGGPPVPVGRGEAPAPLLREAVRKLAALEALAGRPHAVRPDRDRVVRAPGAVEAPGMSETPGAVEAAVAGADRGPSLRRGILLLADGRRTPRDMAFLLGSPVHAVTAETARMLGEGLLARSGPPAAADRAPGTPDGPPLTRRRPRADDAPAAADRDTGLPRRIPGASGRTRTPAGEDPAAGRRGLFRRGGRAPRTRTREGGGPWNGP